MNDDQISNEPPEDVQESYRLLQSLPNSLRQNIQALRSIMDEAWKAWMDGVISEEQYAAYWKIIELDIGVCRNDDSRGPVSPAAYRETAARNRQEAERESQS